MKSLIKSILALVSISFFTTLLANELVTIYPKHPTENDTIKVGIHSLGPIQCDMKVPKTNPQGLNQIIYRNGNNISLHIAGEPVPSFATRPGYCYNIPDEKPDLFFEIGKLPIGNYNLNIFLNNYTQAFSKDKTRTPFTKNLLIQVKKTGSVHNTKSVPTLSFAGLLFLLALIPFSTLVTKRLKNEKTISYPIFP